VSCVSLVLCVPSSNHIVVLSCTLFTCGIVFLPFSALTLWVVWRPFKTSGPVINRGSVLCRPAQMRKWKPVKQTRLLIVCVECYILAFILPVTCWSLLQLSRAFLHIIYMPSAGILVVRCCHFTAFCCDFVQGAGYRVVRQVVGTYRPPVTDVEITTVRWKPFVTYIKCM